MNDFEPRTYEFVVEKYLDGVRIDSFLAKHLRNYTTWRIARMIRAALVTRNHQIIDPDQRVFVGQIFQICLVEPPDKNYLPEPIAFEIVYEDPWILVINKPPGLISHPVGDFQSGTLCHQIQTHLDEQTKLPGILRPGIVHRLDRQTSGIMLIAKEHQAHRIISIDFHKGRVNKKYLALLEGIVAGDSGTIDLPIGRRSDNATALMSISSSATHQKEAITDWQVVERFKNRTLVLASPRTGRNHQIRIHFAAIGHPLVGEPFYLPNDELKSKDVDSDSRHALHAFELEFDHPITGVRMSLRAPFAVDLLCLIHKEKV